MNIPIIRALKDIHRTQAVCDYMRCTDDRPPLVAKVGLGGAPSTIGRPSGGMRPHAGPMTTVPLVNITSSDGIYCRLRSY